MDTTVPNPLTERETAVLRALNARELDLLRANGVERFNRAQRRFWAEYDHGRYTPESLAPIAAELDQIKLYRAAILGTAD